MDDQITQLPLSSLAPPWILLRQVDRHSVEYLEMRDSIAQQGIISSILVRPSPREPGKYEVIEGMYRFTCASELGLDAIPAIIRHDVTDRDLLILQLQANAVRPKTKPCEFAAQLQRIQKSHPDITIGELAEIVSKSPYWISQQLGLLELSEALQASVDRGEISLRNALALSRVPHKFQEALADLAKTLPSRRFAPLVAAAVKQYKEAIHQGRLDAFFTEEFSPVAHLRPLKKICTEYDDPQVGPLLLVSMGCKTAADGWRAALQWVLHLDPDSVKEQEYRARQRIKEKWMK